MSNTSFRRSDIDILRAIAVLSVILFHFDVDWMAGGFLGVDIFFVISGYLITSHINKQIADNSFSFKSFYARRIRRLAPALIVVLVVTSSISLFLLPKTLLNDYSHSLLATILYYSNIYFWSVADYFDTASTLKPLLHTWSLSVEEQFYFVWPIFLILVARFNVFRSAVVLVSIISIIAAELVFKVSANTTFYMFPFRIFEFGIGAYISGKSLSGLKQKNKSIILIGSLLLILLSVLLMDENSRMPGILSLPVCIGSALIILISHSTLNGQNLFSRIFGRIGLSSYSGYLVHWPLVVFYKMETGPTLSSLEVISLVIITLVLAEFSYRFIEKPTSIIQLNQHINKFYLSIPIFAMLALFFIISHPVVYKQIHGREVDVRFLIDNTLTHKETIKNHKIEWLQSKNIKGDMKILVLGDSHSGDFAHSMAYAAGAIYSIDIYHSVCDPLTLRSIANTDLEELYESHGNIKAKSSRCADFHSNFLNTVIAYEPDLVVFSERWRNEALPFLKDTIGEIKNNTDAKILLMGPNFEFGDNPRVLLNHLASVEEINSFSWHSQRNLEKVEKTVLRIAIDTKSYFISKVNIVGPERECELHDYNQLTYTDSNHWSELGFKLYGNRLLGHPVMQGLLNGKGELFVSNSDKKFTYGKLINNRKIDEFLNVGDFFVYKNSNVDRLDNSGLRYLVIGDIAAREVGSALFVNSENINQNVIVSRCFPLSFEAGQVPIDLYKSSLSELFIDECKIFHQNFINMLKKNKPDKLIIAFNWSLTSLPYLEKTLSILKDEVNVEVIIVALKPRVLADKRISWLLKPNALLKSSVEGTNVFDFGSELCSSTNKSDCYSELEKYYTSPNQLSIEGVKLLADIIADRFPGI